MFFSLHPTARLPVSSDPMLGLSYDSSWITIAPQNWAENASWNKKDINSTTNIQYITIVCNYGNIKF